MNVTAFDLAMRFLGVREAPGVANNPMIVSMLKLDSGWASGDDVPWCSAFVNYIAWLLDLPRSKSLAARSWLLIGEAVEHGERGFDVCIFQRGTGPQPGPMVIDAPGHVAFFDAYTEDGSSILVLGGNQGDAVTSARFPKSSLLGIRRLSVTAGIGQGVMT